MAVALIETIKPFLCLSSDTKPTGAPVGSICYETNTGMRYITADGTNWTAYTPAQYLGDDTPLVFGSVAKLLWETADANANALILALPDGGATDVPVFGIGDQTVLNKDLGWFNGITEPTFFVADALAASYVSLTLFQKVCTLSLPQTEM